MENNVRTRELIHDTFVERFHIGKRCKPLTNEKLDSIEKALNSKLPVAYRQFMTKHGAVYTPVILDEIVERNLQHSDIQEFLKYKELIQNTQMYWSGGMPDHVIGFASDCMGNMFGFHRQSTSTDDSPILFFDHDYVVVHEVADSFDNLLAWYIDHLKGSQK